jgi:hypothetical protein
LSSEISNPPYFDLPKKLALAYFKNNIPITKEAFIKKRIYLLIYNLLSENEDCSSMSYLTYS